MVLTDRILAKRSHLMPSGNYDAQTLRPCGDRAGDRSVVESVPSHPHLEHTDRSRVGGPEGTPRGDGASPGQLQVDEHGGPLISTFINV